MKPLFSLVLLTAAIFAANGVSIRTAGAQDGGAIAEAAKSWSDWLRALPEPDFAANTGNGATTQAQESIIAAAGWVKTAADALPVPATAGQQPTMVQDYAKTAAVAAGGASAPFEPAVPNNEPTVAGGSVVTTATKLGPAADAMVAEAATVLSGVTAILPDLGQQPPQQQADQPAAGTGAASAPAASPPADNAPAQVANAQQQDSSTGAKTEDAVPPEPGTADANAADQAAEMMDEVNKGATEILKDLKQGKKIAQADQPAATPTPDSASAGAEGAVPPEPGTEPAVDAVPPEPAMPQNQQALAISTWTYQPQAKAKGLLELEGQGPPGKAVNVYLDGAKVGTTTPAADGSWVLDAKVAVNPGKHSVKAGLAQATGKSPEAAVLTFVRQRGAEPAGSQTPATTVAENPAVTPLKPSRSVTSTSLAPDLGTALPSGSPAAASKGDKVAGDLTAEVNQSLAMSAKLVPSIKLADAKPSHRSKTVLVSRRSAYASLPRRAPSSLSSAGHLVWVRLYRGSEPVLVPVQQVPQDPPSAYTGGAQP